MFFISCFSNFICQNYIVGKKDSFRHPFFFLTLTFSRKLKKKRKEIWARTYELFNIQCLLVFQYDLGYWIYKFVGKEENWILFEKYRQRTNKQWQRVISCVALYLFFKTSVKTVNFNQPNNNNNNNNLACNKKLTTYKQPINVATCIIFAKKKRRREKERKIFKSQKKKKIPLFRISIFPIRERKLTTNSAATSEQNFVRKANWTNNETFRIFKIPAISIKKKK